MTVGDNLLPPFNEQLFLSQLSAIMFTVQMPYPDNVIQSWSLQGSMAKHLHDINTNISGNISVYDH